MVPGSNSNTCYRRNVACLAEVDAKQMIMRFYNFCSFNSSFFFVVLLRSSFKLTSNHLQTTKTKMKLKNRIYYMWRVWTKLRSHQINWRQNDKLSIHHQTHRTNDPVSSMVKWIACFEELIPLFCSPQHNFHLCFALAKTVDGCITISGCSLTSVSVQKISITFANRSEHGRPFLQAAWYDRYDQSDLVFVRSENRNRTERRCYYYNDATPVRANIELFSKKRQTSYLLIIC